LADVGKAKVVSVLVSFIVVRCGSPATSDGLTRWSRTFQDSPERVIADLESV
jgi:hypothetical protein